MSRIDKLKEKAKENPGSLSFAELVKLANHFGYEQMRQKGSHRIFAKGPGFKRFNFQEDHGNSKIAQVREFIDYLEDMGWL